MPRLLCSAVALAMVLVVAPPAARPVAAATAAADSGCRPLSLRERAAQTVMTGVEGTRMTARTREVVAGSAGGVVLMGRNIRTADQVRRFTRELRTAGRVRTLVAVDEEGGRVARLGEKGIVDRVPSARTLARTRTPAQIRRVGARLGTQMMAVGVQWNFAPVLDVADARRDTVIGDRSYSGDPAVVAAAGRAFAEGLRSAGVKTTGKHFPGHGRTTVDSHHRLPTIDASLAQLRRRDLKPFVAALPALDAVMTAHVRYTALDRRRPASLSRPAHRLLRHDLGFRGLVVTDSLDMGAITRHRTIPQAGEQALRAGADVLLVTDPSAAPRIKNRLVRAIREERLSRRRLNQAVGRVLTAKGYSRATVDCLLGG